MSQLKRPWWELDPRDPAQAKERARLKSLADRPSRPAPEALAYPRRHYKQGNSWIGAQRVEFNPNDPASERWAHYLSLQDERLDGVKPVFIDGMLVVVDERGIRYGVPHASTPAEIAQLVYNIKMFRMASAGKERE